jgi:hypothetical protein
MLFLFIMLHTSTHQGVHPDSIANDNSERSICTPIPTPNLLSRLFYLYKANVRAVAVAAKKFIQSSNPWQYPHLHRGCP